MHKNINYSLSKIISAISLSGLILLSFNPQAVKAAESIVLKYGQLKATISVEELSTFAKTGEMSDSLESYFILANQKPSQIRTVLNQKIPIEGVLLSKILNHQLGTFFLTLVTEYIETPQNKSAIESLRTALISSASSDNSIELIEIIENYPSSEISLQGEKLLELYTKLDQVIKLISVK